MARNVLVEQSIMTAAYGIIVFCGLFLNAWAALTISTRRQLRGSIYAFMISLAMADFLMDLLVVPWFIVAMWTDDWDLHQPPWPSIIKYLPMLISYLCWVLRFISIASILAIAVSRYYVILHEDVQRTDKSTICIVATVLIWWHGLLCTAIPRMLSKPNSSVCLSTFALPGYIQDNISSFPESEYAVEVNVFVFYVTSLMIVIYIYHKIRTYGSSTAKYYVRRTTTNQMEELRVQNEASVQLLREGVVVIDETSAREVFKLDRSASSCQIISCFVILWMPYFVFNLYRAFTCGNDCSDPRHIYHYIDFSTTWFTFLSTIVNPVLYVLRNDQLKHDIKSLETARVEMPRNNESEQHLLEEIKYKVAPVRDDNSRCRYDVVRDNEDDDDMTDSSGDEDDNLVSVSTINLAEEEQAKANMLPLSLADKPGMDKHLFKTDSSGYLKSDNETDSGLVLNRIRPYRKGLTCSSLNRPQSPPSKYVRYDHTDTGSLPRGNSSSTSEFEDSDSSGVWLKSNGEDTNNVPKPILKTFLPRVDEISLDRTQLEAGARGGTLPRARRSSVGSEILIVTPKVPRKNVNFVEPNR